MEERPLFISRQHRNAPRQPLPCPTPSPDWRDRLPAAWQGEVLTPVSFEVHRDAELAAARCFGYDARRSACYYAHHYAVTEWRSDDDEEFYLCTLYGETLAAWRLRDGRWLVHRRVCNDEQGEGHGFYSFSPAMPR
jgi:hypothetical protein